MDVYYQTYKLVTGFVSPLDSTLDATEAAAATAKGKSEPNGSPPH